MGPAKLEAPSGWNFKKLSHPGLGHEEREAKGHLRRGGTGKRGKSSKGKGSA